MDRQQLQAYLTALVDQPRSVTDDGEVVTVRHDMTLRHTRLSGETLVGFVIYLDIEGRALDTHPKGHDLSVDATLRLGEITLKLPTVTGILSDPETKTHLRAHLSAAFSAYIAVNLLSFCTKVARHLNGEAV